MGSGRHASGVWAAGSMLDGPARPGSEPQGWALGWASWAWIGRPKTQKLEDKKNTSTKIKLK